MSKTPLLLVFAAVASAVGFYFFWVAGAHLYGYIADADSPVRHEYLAGVFLALALSFPAWLLVSGLTYPIRRDLPRDVYLAWNAPTAFLSVGGIGVMLYTGLLAWRQYAT